MTPKKIVVAIVALAALALIAWFVFVPREQSGGTLNLLCWSGYEDPDFIQAFEDRHGIQVNAKTFFGGDGMMALLTQSPGTYDVVVVDKDYLQKLFEAGLLTELDPSNYDFSKYWEPFQYA